MLLPTSYIIDDENDGGSSKKSKSNIGLAISKRITTHTSCPVHPGMKHTWGKCRANAYNHDRSKKHAHIITGKNKATTVKLSGAAEKRPFVAAAEFSASPL